MKRALMFAVIFMSNGILLSSLTSVHAQTLGTSAAIPAPVSSYSSTTGIFSSVSGAVSITSGGTEKMRVNATGVGINTSTPNYPLEVDTSNDWQGISIRQNANDNSGAVFRPIKQRGTGSASANDWVGGIEYDIVNSSSNVQNVAAAYAIAPNVTAGSEQGDIQFYNRNGASWGPNMIITHSGNVGIGTTSPAESLDVNGNISILSDQSQLYGYYTSSTTEGGGLRYNSYYNGTNDSFKRNGYAGLWTFNNGVWQLQISNASGTAGNTITYIAPITVLTSGNVGIGTTSPAESLDVNGNISILSDQSQLYGYYTSSTTEGGGLRYNSYYNGTNDSFKRNGYAGLWTFNNGVWQLQISNASGTAGNTITYIAPITVLTSGNVGIGTSAPLNKLDVAGAMAIGASYAGIITAPTNGMIVQGNVGIGMTNPTLALDVNGMGRFISPNNSTTGGVVIRDASGNPNAAYLQFVNNSNSTQYGYVQGLSAGGLSLGGGNVGIATASPSYTLHVNGTAYAAGAAGALSDMRHKKNIQPLTFGLHEVEQLNPVTFEWIEPMDNGMIGQQIGFVAQQVEKVLPTVVLTEDNDEQTKDMKYTEIIPVLTKAIQELKAENDNQAAALTDLRKDFEDYKTAHP